jgi:hypothetical protein
MSSKKPAAKPDVNKARLQALKKLGLMSGVDSRKALTDSQKKKVRTEWKKYHAVANADKGEWTKRDISKLTTSDKKKLADSGYLIAGDKAFIPNQGYDTASIRQQWTKDKKTGKWEKRLEVVRKKGDRKEEIEYIGKPLDKLEWRDRLLKEYEQGKFKENDYIAVKVFDNGVFEREIVTNINTLFRYISNVSWHDKDKEKMLDNLHIVKISVKDFRDITANQKTRKEENHTRYIRKKKSKATKTKSLVGKVNRK